MKKGDNVKFKHWDTLDAISLDLFLSVTPHISNAKQFYQTTYEGKHHYVTETIEGGVYLNGLCGYVPLEFLENIDEPIVL